MTKSDHTAWDEMKGEAAQAEDDFLRASKPDRRRADGSPRGRFAAPAGFRHEFYRLHSTTLGRALNCGRMIQWLLFDHTQTTSMDFSFDIPEDVTTLPEMLIWRKFLLSDDLLFKLTCG